VSFCNGYCEYSRKIHLATLYQKQMHLMTAE